MSNTFAGLGVSRSVADALRSRGIESPFPVQELVINDVLEGHDVLVQSPTGSGKTLAFGVPIVDKVDFEAKRPAALILAPTRELASQIVDELESICRARGVGIAAVYGGVGIQPQIRSAPNVDVDVTLTDEEEQQLAGHYGEPTRILAGDDGPEAEMVRSEEEVDISVAPAKPRERVRLRKHTVVDQVETTVPVRREEIRLEHEPPPDGKIVDVEDA